MRKQLARLLVAASIVTASVAVVPVSVVFTGCSQLPSTSAETSDQVILRAQQTAQAARLTFYTFVKLERDNEALLKQVSPAIHDYANVIRRSGLNWVDSLRHATDTFEGNRSPENRATLDTWLKTVNDAISQSNQYIAQARNRVSHP